MDNSAEITPLDALSDLGLGQCISCGMTGTAWCLAPVKPPWFPADIIAVLIACEPCRTYWAIGVTGEELATFNLDRMVAKVELADYQQTQWEVAKWVSEAFERERQRLACG